MNAQSTKLKSLFFLLFLFTLSFTPGIGKTMDFFNPLAAQFSITQQGIDVLTYELLKNVLKEEQVVNIPDIRTKADYGIDVYLQGITAIIRIEDIDLINRDGFLDFSLHLKNSQVNIQRIRAEKGTIFGDIGVTCHDTQLFIAQNSRVTLKAEMVPSVNNQQVTVGPRNVDFPLSEQNFQVGGPRSCSGGPLERYVKDIIRGALEKSREKVQEVVRNYVPKATQSLEQQLNQLAHQNLDFDLEFPPYAPRLKVLGATAPEEVQVIPDQLTIGFSWQLKNMFEEMVLSLFNSRTKSSEETFLEEEWSQFGKIGITQSLFNDVLSLVYQQNREHFEERLNADVAPKLKDIINQETLKKVIPDLANRQLDSSELGFKLSLSPLTIPTIEFREDLNMLFLKTPLLKATVFIKEKGEWKPYYHFTFEFMVHFTSQIVEGKLALQFHSITLRNIQGNWEDSARPPQEESQSINYEELRNIIEVIKEVIEFHRPKINIDLPTIHLGDHDFLLREIKIQDKFLNVEMITKRK